jgi:transcription initiation factor TFIIIB Brf1 subunit/transcription initiation factor TFIIB
MEIEIKWMCPACREVYTAFSDVDPNEEYWCSTCGYVTPLLDFIPEIEGEQRWLQKTQKFRKKDRKRSK